MKKHFLYPFWGTVAFILIIALFSCSKLREANQKPELESLQQGLKTSIAVAYCVLVAHSAFQGEPYIDLGNSLFSFHKNCDGMIHVELSTGKYFSFINKNIALDIQ